jgi:fructokinase
MDFRIIGIGEVLWDLLQSGPQLGGAPANFAYHAHALGAEAHVITRVGNDERGREILRRFRDMGLQSTTVQSNAVESDAVQITAVQVDDHAPTGTASVTLSGNGIAHFTIQQHVAWDYLAATPGALALVSKADAICFGSLAQRSEASCRAIQQLVASSPQHALRVFDVNLRRPFFTRDVIEPSLQLANVLKLNDDELPTLSAMFELTGSTENQIESLAQLFRLQVVALTRGPNGSLLYQESEQDEPCGGGTPLRQDATQPHHHARWSDCRSRPVKIVDTVGAGDSFTAALVLGLLCKMDLDEINNISNEVARYVCSHSGATPQLPPEFAKVFSGSA